MSRRLDDAESTRERMAHAPGDRGIVRPIFDPTPWDLQVRVDTDPCRPLRAGEVIMVSPNVLHAPKYADVSGFNLSIVWRGVEMSRDEAPAFEMTLQIGCKTELDWSLISNCNDVLKNKPKRISSLQSFMVRLRPVVDLDRTGLILMFSFRGTLFREVI